MAQNHEAVFRLQIFVQSEQVSKASLLESIKRQHVKVICKEKNNKHSILNYRHISIKCVLRYCNTLKGIYIDRSCHIANVKTSHDNGLFLCCLIDFYLLLNLTLQAFDVFTRVLVVAS